MGVLSRLHFLGGTNQEGRNEEEQKPTFLDILLFLLFITTAAINIACDFSGTKSQKTGSEPTVSLLPEDRVRLSNDPQKTEIFRDAGLGLFIHWGPNSQVGTEISWPLYNASEDFIKKYYALADTLRTGEFGAFTWGPDWPIVVKITKARPAGIF